MPIRIIVSESPPAGPWAVRLRRHAMDWNLRLWASGELLPSRERGMAGNSRCRWLAGLVLAFGEVWMGWPYRGSLFVASGAGYRVDRAFYPFVSTACRLSQFSRPGLRRLAPQRAVDDRNEEEREDRRQRKPTDYRAAQRRVCSRFALPTTWEHADDHGPGPS